ncbi:MAG TPA: hypothetical protein VF170_07945 [Planctomycetaceae bacterium]
MSTAMHLVQLLLPLYDNDGRRFPEREYAEVRWTLTERFGGVTAYHRAPAEGLWKEEDGSAARDEVVIYDEIVIYEVMTDDLDRGWWEAFRERLRGRFRQEDLVVRAMPIERL